MKKKYISSHFASNINNNNLYMPGYYNISQNNMLHQADTTWNSNIENNDLDSSITNRPNTSSSSYDFSERSHLDYEYLIFLYPYEARKLKALIDDELDKLEYEGSIIYHEYPDKINMQMILNNVYDNYSCSGPECGHPVHPCRGNNCPPPYHPPENHPNKKPNWLRQLIDTLFYNEMINRRRRYWNINNLR